MGVGWGLRRQQDTSLFVYVPSHDYCVKCDLVQIRLADFKVRKKKKSDNVAIIRLAQKKQIFKSFLGHSENDMSLICQLLVVTGETFMQNREMGSWYTSLGQCLFACLSV